MSLLRVWCLAVLLAACCMHPVAADQDEGVVDDVVDLFQSIVHNITTRLQKKLVESISKQTCANNGAGEDDPTMDGCFQDGVAIPRVAEPEFWADVSRAARLSSLSYTPLNKLVAKELAGTGVQLVSTFENKLTSCEGMITLRQEIIPLPSMHSLMQKCEKVRGGLGNSKLCRKDILKDRERLWQEYESKTTFAKADPKVPPARLEVTIRGSQQLTDWVQNARFRQKPLYPRILGFETVGKRIPEAALQQVRDKDIEVHAGFRSQFVAVHEQVEELLKPYEASIRTGKTQLHFCGHSLGGAVAQLLAVHTAIRLGVKPTVITFGSPRVGSPAWAAFEREKVTHFRFKYLVDPVPELPLKEIMGFKYEHGDTAAYSFSVLPPGSKRSAFLLPMQVLCTPECGRGRMDPALAAIVHSSDLSYSTAASLIFMNMRDYETVPGPYFPGGGGGGRKQNNQFLADIEQAFNTQLAIDQAVITLQCFGDRFCEHMRKYPGVPLEKHIECLKVGINKRKAGEVDMLAPRIARYGEIYRHSLKDRETAADLEEEAQAFMAKEWLTQFLTVVQATNLNNMEDAEEAIAKCLGPLDKSYYAKFTPQDWALCGGNYRSLILVARQKGLVRQGQ